nr:putative disease resistance protein [Quercus suber]
MAAASVGGAALGAAFGEGFAVLHDTVKDVVSKARMFKPILKRLESTLNNLAPMVNEITQLSEQLDLRKVETENLIENMKKGEKLVRKCLKIRWWNYCFKVYYSDKLEELDKEIVRFCQVDLQVHSTRNGLRTLVNVNLILQKVDSVVDRKGVPCTVRDPPDFTVGLDMPMKELKTLLLKEEVQLLLLTAPGGCGKTTLVQMLCQDDQIRGMFEDNILFVNVSKTPNVKVIVQNLLNYKNMQPNFQIQSDEDAIDQLSQLLNHLRPNPILLILDDVWLGSESLPEKFKFDLPNYKILVTSRTAFPRLKFTYHLKPLDDVDAMTLFRHSASLHDENSYIPAEEDAKKIVRGCGGFPLVIKVIGGSLRRQHEVVWHSRLMKWSDGQFYFSSDTELLGHLQKSLEFSDDKVIIKECFMDLGSFPEDQRIPATALIDMWAELYKLDEDGIRGISNLQELNMRNLASLVMARKDASEVKSYYNEDFVTQHDILRELAMHQSSQEPVGQRPRLIINISGNNLPKWWTEQKQQLINARLLSISTDELFSSSWCYIQGSKVEVLVLNFHSKNYTLPEFVEKMDKLKVSNAFPNLTEINIDYCNDLEELPVGLCDIVHLKKISITNCHKLFALPEEIGKLVNLEVLRLRSCTDLSELPNSIRSLHKLSILDISDCLSIMKLPKHIGELCNLKELNMKGCLRLRSQFPESIMDLEQLKLVVCDEERARLWEPIKEFLPELKVEVAEKDINLNWLSK